MKKILLSAAICFLSSNKANACADYNPDLEYFNLFSQEIIQNKFYEPFLLTYSNNYYGYDYSDRINKNIPDENTESWVKYFNNELSYDETDALIKVIQVKHLQNFAKGNLTHQLFQKLGKKFYAKYKSAFQYLIKAKELEAYMRINYISNPNAYYYRDENSNTLNATQLDYNKTLSSLSNLYKNTTDKELKLRYAYQIVRLNHYTRRYQKAIDAFASFVEPLKLKNHMYYYALDQKAGAQRGLGKFDEANWNFFQVFKNTQNKKESAYNSMFLAKEKDFNQILNRAKTSEDKNMAYFLLAYNNFSNPVPIMDKMIENNADSEILKVLTVRAINQLERNYLPVDYYCYDDCEKYRNQRLPFFKGNGYTEEADNFSKDLEKTIAKAKAKKGSDDFWQLSEAYLKFLNKDYRGSMQILNSMTTTDKVYLAEIQKFKMLNDLVSQPKITPEFENEMMAKYKNIFEEERPKSEPWGYEPLTKDFVLDILANRYFLQKENGKSFLVNNRLSDLQFSPNSSLVKEVEAFYLKPNKNEFEKYLTKKMENIADPTSFFNVIYGDRAMRLADFETAKRHYEKAKNFRGIPRNTWEEVNGKYQEALLKFENGVYNGFQNISNLVFGHSVWESFNSKPNESMKAEHLQNFPFIKEQMNKIELADAMIQLKKIGESKNNFAEKANQLIGNLLYNTSVLGYFREIFVMDVDNYNGPKFQFGNSDSPYHLYYKNFGRTSFIEPDNFDLAIHYYQKAFDLSKDKENQARILFQMASAEQGKYYQWEAKQTMKADEKDYEKHELFLAENKNKLFRSSFAKLKQDFAQTKTAKDLQSSCLYFGHYMKK